MLGENQSLICLESKLGEHPVAVAILPQCEGPVAKRRLKFNGMFSPRFVALRIRSPGRNRNAQLPGDIGQKNLGGDCIRRHCPTGIAQIAELNGKPQTVMHAAPLPDEAHLRLVEGVVPPDFLL